MQKKKLNERTLVDELLENQDVAIDIIIHEDVREEVPSSSKKQKASKHTNKSSEKYCAARKTERERLKQLSDVRKDNLKLYIKNFSNRATNKLVVSFNFLINTLTIFFIFYAKNKHMLLLVLKKNLVWEK